MPHRTRKHIYWWVDVKSKGGVKVRSKTYVGACHKAFKKLGIKPPKFKKTRTYDYTQPDTIMYNPEFQNVSCVAYDEYVKLQQLTN